MSSSHPISNNVQQTENYVREPDSQFYAKQFLIIGIATLIFAAYVHTQFLAHNTIMTYSHKVFLYGLYATAGVGLISFAGLQLKFSRSKNCCI